MKVTFDGKELTWLHTYINALVLLTQKRTDTESVKLYKSACNMRYKFTPNASYVHLKRSERELVHSLATHRAKEIGTDVMSDGADEYPVVTSIMNKTGEK